MPTDKTFKVGKDVYDIPAHEVANFLKDNPQATEVQSFVMGKDTFDIPLPEVGAFIKDVPDAKPLKKKEPTVSGVTPSESPKTDTEVSLDIPDVPKVPANTPTESDLSNERRSVRPDSFLSAPKRLTSSELIHIDKNFARILYQHNQPNVTTTKGQTTGEANAVKRRQQASLQGAIMSLQEQKKSKPHLADDFNSYNPERAKLDKEIQAKKEQLKSFQEPEDMFDRIPGSDNYAENKDVIENYLKNIEIADPEGYKTLKSKAEKGVLTEQEYFTQIVSPALNTQLEVLSQDFDILKERGLVDKAAQAYTLFKDIEEIKGKIENYKGGNPTEYESLVGELQQKDEELKSIEGVEQVHEVMAKTEQARQAYGNAVLAIGKDLGIVADELTDEVSEHIFDSLDQKREERSSYWQGSVKTFGNSVANVFDDIDKLGKFAAKHTGLGDILLDKGYEGRKGLFGDAAEYFRRDTDYLNDMPETWMGTMLNTAIPMTTLIAEMAMFPEVRMARLAKATGGVVKAIPAFTVMEGTLGGVREWDKLATANPEDRDIVLETLKATGEGAAMGTGLHFLGAFGGETAKFAAKYAKGNFIPAATAFGVTGTAFGTLDAFEQYLQTGRVDLGQSTAVGVGASVLSAPHVMKALVGDAYKKARQHYSTASKEVIQKAHEMPAQPEELLREAIEQKKQGNEKEANVLNTMANVKMVAEEVVANPEKFRKEIKESTLTDKEKEFHLAKIEETVKSAKELRAKEDNAIIENQKRLNLPTDVAIPIADATGETLLKMEAGEPVINARLKEASKDLYSRYKGLVAERDNHNRKNTTEQIDKTITDLEGKIEKLETRLQEQGETGEFMGIIKPEKPVSTEPANTEPAVSAEPVAEKVETKVLNQEVVKPEVEKEVVDAKPEPPISPPQVAKTETISKKTDNVPQEGKSGTGGDIKTFELIENEGKWKATTKTYRGRETGNWVFDLLDKKQKSEYEKIKEEADTYGTKEQAEANLKKLQDFEIKNKEVFVKAKEQIDNFKQAEEKENKDKADRQKINDKTANQLSELSDSDFEKLINLIDKDVKSTLEKRFGDRIERKILFKNRIAEDYHKAKSDGSNPELIKAVEYLLASTPSGITHTEKPIITPEKVQSVSQKSDKIATETDDIRIVDGEVFTKVKNATAAKKGYAFFSNGKSRFAEGYKSIQLPERLEVVSEKAMSEFEAIAKGSKTAKEAFNKAQKVKGISEEISKEFRDKYDPEGKLTPEQTFEKFYNEVNNKPAKEIRDSQIENKPLAVNPENKGKSQAGKAIEPNPEVKTDLETAIYEVATQIDPNSFKGIDGKPQRTKHGLLHGENGKLLFEIAKGKTEKVYDESNLTDEQISQKISEAKSALRKTTNTRGIEFDIEQLTRLKKDRELYNRLSKMEDAGYIEEVNEVYTVTEKGQAFINAVNARIETRKGVKAGTDLFPEYSGIPEVESKLKQITDEHPNTRPETVRAFAGKTESESKQLEPVVKTIEGKAKIAGSLKKEAIERTIAEIDKEIGSVNESKLRLDELNNAIAKLKSDNPKEFKKDGTLKANSKIAPALKSLSDKRADTADKYAKEFPELSKKQKEASRKETDAINKAFEERQKDLEARTNTTKEEILEASVEDKLRFREPLTKEEITYANENMFRPKGFDYGEDGLEPAKVVEQVKDIPQDKQNVSDKKVVDKVKKDDLTTAREDFINDSQSPSTRKTLEVKEKYDDGSVRSRAENIEQLAQKGIFAETKTEIERLKADKNHPDAYYTSGGYMRDVNKTKYTLDGFYVTKTEYDYSKSLEANKKSNQVDNQVSNQANVVEQTKDIPQEKKDVSVRPEVQTSVNKYGWNAEINKQGNTDLYNSKGKKVATVVFKGDKYVISDTGGNKLMSGKGQVGKSVESLLKDHYYAKEVEPAKVGIDSKTVPLKDAGVLAQSLVGAFKSSELAINDRIEYAKNLENEFLALNKVTKESLDKMSASQKAELQNKFYDWVEKYYPHFKFERTKIGQDSKLKTIPDLQEALQAGKITKAEFDKQVEEIRSVQPKDAKPGESVGTYNNGQPVVLGGLDFIRPVELPEMVALAKELIGSPVVRKMSAEKNGMFRGGKGITLNRELFKQGNEKQLAATLAHEIGHLVDFLPDKTMKRGNLLGRLYTLREFMNSGISDTKPWTSGELKELKNEARDGVLAENNITIDNWNKGKLPTAEKKRIGQEIDAEYKRLKTDNAILLNSDISKELKELSKLWRPWDETTATAKFKSYRNSSAELYADAISVLLNNPGLLETKAPKFYDKFFGKLDNKPEVRDAMFALQDLIRDPVARDEARLEAIYNGFSAAREKRKAIANEEIVENKLKGWNLFVSNFVSKIAPSLKFMPSDKRLGIELSAKQALRNQLEMLSFINNKEYLYIKENEVEVFAALDAIGVKFDDLGALGMFNRNLSDRLEKANPLGLQQEMNADLRKMLLDKYSPEQADVAEQILKNFHKKFFTLVEDGYKEGLYKDDVWKEKIEPYKDTYLSYAVVDYITKNHISEGVKEMTGTLREVENPIESTMLKALSVIRATQTQRAKNLLFENLHTLDPDNISDARPIFSKPNNDRTGNFAEETGKAQIKYYKNGVWSAKNVDPWIAEVFTRTEPAHLDALTQLFHNFNAGFKPAVTKYNLGFAFAMNLERDSRRSVSNLYAILNSMSETKRPVADMLLGPASWLWHLPKSVREGYRIGKNQFSDLATEMVENAAFDFRTGVLNKYDPNANESVDIMYSKYGLGNHRLSKGEALKKRGPILKSLINFHDFYSSVTGAMELGSKVNGYKILRKRGLSAESAGFYTRNYIGTPNYKERGNRTYMSNEYLPFSNVIAQGIRADAELAFTGKTAGAYWLAQTMWTVAPAMVLGSVAAGMAGSYMKDLYSGIGSYDLLNYLCVPYGKTETGKTKYVRIAMDEFSRAIYANSFLLSKSLTEKDTPSINEFTQIAKVGSSFTPSISPLYKIASANYSYWVDQTNPYDSFYDRKIVNQTNFDAGGWDSHKQMLSWTVGASGLSFVTRLSQYDPSRNTTSEYVKKNLPIWNRIMKESDQGIYERSQDVVDENTTESAKERLVKDELIFNYAKKYYSKTRTWDSSLFDQMMKEMSKEYFGSETKGGISAEDRPAYDAMYKKFKTNVAKGIQSPITVYVTSVVNKRSNKDKAEQLALIKKEIDPKVYKELITFLINERMITPDVMRKANTVNNSQ